MTVSGDNIRMNQLFPGVSSCPPRRRGITVIYIQKKSQKVNMKNNQQFENQSPCVVKVLAARNRPVCFPRHANVEPRLSTPNDLFLTDRKTPYDLFILLKGKKINCDHVLFTWYREIDDTTLQPTSKTQLGLEKAEDSYHFSFEQGFMFSGMEEKWKEMFMIKK